MLNKIYSTEVFMKKATLLSIALSLTASLSYAHDFTGCKVIEIIASGEKNGHIQLNCTVNPRPNNCVAGNYVGFDKSTTEGKQYLSMALTAFARNAKVTGDVDSTSCSPYQGNVPWLKHLRLSK